MAAGHEKHVLHHENVTRRKGKVTHIHTTMV